ncbi:hypothetical protein EON62_04365 [archaeon]|nr:MAG: hypothetical protein EON62_04365 [archaeon]
MIGILTNPNYITGYTQYSSYFPASYVKWLEMAGARVVPIPFDADATTVTTLLKQLNGAFFTGGGTNFVNPDGSMAQFSITAQLIFNESVTAWQNGETWPLWGTCQGHELVSYLAANADISVLSGPFDSENYTIPLDFTPVAPKTRMVQGLSANAVNIFATQPVTMNNHQQGVAPATFQNTPGLGNRFTLIATNVDRAGKPFVSAMEGNNGLPIYTSQFHPEKVQFECTWRADARCMRVALPTLPCRPHDVRVHACAGVCVCVCVCVCAGWNQEVMNHSYDSILANHELSLFFVNQTRMNST